MDAALPLCQIGFELVAGADGPILHRGLAQTTHLLDEHLLDLIGGAHFAFRALGNFQDRFETLSQLRMPPHPLQQGCFFGTEFIVFVSHSQLNA